MNHEHPIQLKFPSPVFTPRTYTRAFITTETMRIVMIRKFAANVSFPKFAESINYFCKHTYLLLRDDEWAGARKDNNLPPILRAHGRATVLTFNVDYGSFRRREYNCDCPHHFEFFNNSI